MLKSKANWNFIQRDKSDHVTTEMIVEELLTQRGIEQEEKQTFLQPTLDDISDPATLNDIDVAKERIIRAIENDEKIIVYGDYDADGVTSTALFMRILLYLGANCQYYIPNRFEEGYGLNKQALQQLKEDGASLVITVDNGIANIEEARFAKELRLDLIITDHHEIQDELPEAIALIHPELSPNYPFKQLAGVGVTFQLCHYLIEEVPVEVLDLVAIGTIADLVPLIGENRILTTYGLKQLTNSQNIGIQALKECCRITDDVTTTDVGFQLGPRINAVGRLQDASLAVELLLTENREVAMQIAQDIEALNVERQRLVDKIVREAEKRVDPNKYFIILYDETWHEGVLGIAASRLVQRLNRPVMMLKHHVEVGELKGSARSIHAFNLFEHCMHIRHLFKAFGGHAQAAGLTFSIEHLEEIESALNEAVKRTVTIEQLRPEINIQRSLPLELLTENLVGAIDKLAPFGMENEEPIFHIEAIPTQIRQIGQDKRHLKLQFSYEEREIEAIGFQIGHLYYALSRNVPVELVGTLQLNEWNGVKKVQLLIQDIAVNEWQLFDYRGRQQPSFIEPYFSLYERHVIVGNKLSTLYEQFDVPKQLTFFSYEDDPTSLQKTDILYVYDLPENLDKLKQIVTQTAPDAIHVSYRVTNDNFLFQLPSRDEFKWLYGFLMKYEPIPLETARKRVSELTKWTEDKVTFMFNVFTDLYFIIIDEGHIFINEQAGKSDLQTSKTYQQRIELSEIEKTLYYSSFEQLKNYFERWMSKQASEEEIVYEL